MLTVPEKLLLYIKNVLAQKLMCYVCVPAVVVSLEPLVGAETYVNGKRITDGVALKQGNVSLHANFYIVNNIKKN